MLLQRFSITWVCKSIAVHVWVSQRRASSQQVMHFDMIASQVLSAHTHAVYNQSIDTCPWSCKFNRTVLDASRHLDLYPASLAMDHTKSFCVVKFKVPKVSACQAALVSVMLHCMIIELLSISQDS